MTDDEYKHFIRVHRPFSVPKQWVVGPPGAITFTDDQSKCGKYTEKQAIEIMNDLQQYNLIVALDAI